MQYLDFTLAQYRACSYLADLGAALLHTNDHRPLIVFVLDHCDRWDGGHVGLGPLNSNKARNAGFNSVAWICNFYRHGHHSRLRLHDWQDTNYFSVEDVLWKGIEYDIGLCVKS